MVKPDRETRAYVLAVVPDDLRVDVAAVCSLKNARYGPCSYHPLGVCPRTLSFVSTAAMRHAGRGERGGVGRSGSPSGLAEMFCCVAG